MAKTKATGGTKLGRDSLPKYLGIKLFAGERAKVGQILVKQRGTKFMAGKNVKRGGDDTLFALKDGVVYFTRKKKISFDRSLRTVNIVNVLSK
jgi:large subunit ribosomal protein L27